MNQRIAAILDGIRQLESQLELELARRRLELAFTVRGGVVRFEEHVLERHRHLKTRLSAYVLGARPLMLLTAPVIYSLVIPLVLLDLFVWSYQRICFPVFGLATVPRADYIVFDRGQLAYLNLVEKINCTYCSYANGLIAYVREVASITEQFWCPIKHARRLTAAHARYGQFADFGDAEQYHAELEALRQQLRREGRRS